MRRIVPVFSRLGAALALSLAGCTGPGVTLPPLPPWQAPQIAPTATLPTPEAIPALRVQLEAQIRYPGVPVSCADGTYTLVSRAWLDRYCNWEWQAAKAGGVTYTPESFDCDDFSLGFYFFATLSASRSGIHAAPAIARLVVQYDAVQRHELCGAATDQGLVIIEPQPDAGPFRITPLAQYDKPILSITFGDSSPAAARITAARPHAAFLPDPNLTPGVADPAVTARNLEAHTKTPRMVTAGEKARVYAKYGVKVHRPGQYEIDHLISRELGGTDEEANLWPQSYSGPWNAHHKDRLENELHRRVLSDRMPLHEAQVKIAADWVALYCEIFPQDVVGGVPRVLGKQKNAEPDATP